MWAMMWAMDTNEVLKDLLILALIILLGLGLIYAVFDFW